MSTAVMEHTGAAAPVAGVASSWRTNPVAQAFWLLRIGFTVAPENVSRLPKRVDGVAISCIGEITAERAVVQVKEKNRVWNLEPKGFEHFADANL